jgi:LAS superfamily LD-carboxypeptidase LdcB
MSGFMKKISIFQWLISFGFLLLAGSTAYGAWYGYKQVVGLKLQVASLHDALNSTTDLLKDTIASTSATLTAQIDQQRQTVDSKFGNIDSKFGNVEASLGSVSGSVSNLQKLSQTDPQLLAKYSKIFFLNEHYAPERVLQIPQTYVYSDTRPEVVEAHVEPHLETLLAAAKNSGVSLYVKSAYRSFDQQQALKGAYTVTYGAGTANQFSADQGYSEHQLGTAVDFISSGQGGILDGFDATSAFTWMKTNAYKYGFELSYPKANAYYTYEPWHWRFVGVKLATDLHNQGKNFYDLDQRAIDTYLINIFD